MPSIGCRKISLEGRNKQVLIYNEEIQWESPGLFDNCRHIAVV